MSTNSTIAIEKANGQVEAIYCHWDGYLDGVGQELLDNYCCTENVQELIDEGHHSSIAGEAVSYKSMGRGEQPAQKYSNLKSYVNEGDFEEYNYLFKESDESWYLIKSNAIIPLEGMVQI